MCSHFLQRMENYQGDLADIVRAAAAVPEWQFPSNPISYSSDPVEDFGDPFTYSRDLLLQNMDTSPLPGFFCNSNMIKNSVEESGTSGGFGSNINLANQVFEDEMKGPANSFSRVLQISPNAAAAPPPPSAGPPLLVSNNHPLSSKECLVESTGLQISSPRNTGIKRRKSQAKKVICIPAPAPANSRASGEVVPSDLWAWRKYGQKPIKGSPYPRGYYRCSSSKGCSARKQVERSRTDPNMLVITYTSEHNHPWPTQRNALAGSTRSQPTKTNTAAKISPNSIPQKPTTPKQEHNEINTATSSTAAAVKEEMDQELDNQLEMEEPEFDDGFPYKPTLADSSHSDDSFFADLGEIEADPLELMFPAGFSGDGGREERDLDPFGFYDWAANGGDITAAGESNRDS